MSVCKDCGRTKPLAEPGWIMLMVPIEQTRGAMKVVLWCYPACARQADPPTSDIANPSY